MSIEDRVYPIIIALLLLSGCIGDGITNETPRLLAPHPLEVAGEMSSGVPAYSTAQVGGNLVWFRLSDALINPTALTVRVSARYEYRMGGSSFQAAISPIPELQTEMRLPAKGVFVVQFIREHYSRFTLQVDVGGYRESFIAIETVPGRYLTTWHHTGMSGTDHHFTWIF